MSDRQIIVTVADKCEECSTFGKVLLSGQIACGLGIEHWHSTCLANSARLKDMKESWELMKEYMKEYSVLSMRRNPYLDKVLEIISKQEAEDENRGI